MLKECMLLIYLTKINWDIIKMVVDQEWRLDQLKFLFVYGFCEIPNVGVDLAPQFKEAFYHALDHNYQS